MPTAHPPHATDAGQDKKALRRQIRAARRELVAVQDRTAAGAAVAEAALRLLRPDLPVVAGERRHGRRDSPATTAQGRGSGGAGTGVRCVAAYESLPTEPPTEALIAALLDRGFRVIVPVLLGDLDLDWREASRSGSDADVRSGRTLRREGNDAGETLGREAIGEAGLVITPALAVDRSGTRLGQGGGSYDRALARRDPGALVVAVVQDDELVDGPLPAEGHDVRVDAVITPGRGLVRLPTHR